MTTPHDIEVLVQLVAAEPENPRLLLQLAEAYQRAADNQKAAAAFMRAAHAFERAGEVLNARSATHRAQELAVPLIEELNNLVAADPENVRLLARLGEVHQFAGDHSNAADTFARIATSYERDGYFLKAQALLRQAKRLDPSRADFDARLAELSQELAHPPAARAEDPAAPAVMRRLQPLWLQLAAERQLELGCQWVDHSLRVMLVEVFARAGFTEQATALSTLPEIDGVSALAFARERLSLMTFPDEPIEALAVLQRGSDSR